MVTVVFSILTFGVFLYQVKISMERYLSRPVVTETSTILWKDIEEPVFMFVKKWLTIQLQKNMGMVDNVL